MPPFRDFPSWKSLCCNFRLHDIELRPVFTPESPIRGHFRVLLPISRSQDATFLYGAHSVRCDSIRLAIANSTCSCAVFFAKPL